MVEPNSIPILLFTSPLNITIEFELFILICTAVGELLCNISKVIPPFASIGPCINDDGVEPASGRKTPDGIEPVGPTGPGVTQSGFTYQFSHSPMDPVDNMDYYIGNISDSPAQSSNSIASRRVKSMTSGEVKQVSIMTQILGELGSNDEQTFILRNNTTNNSVTITSNYTNSSNSKLDNYILDTPLELSINDELEVIWRVNIFEVNPTGVRHNFNIYCL